MTAVHPSKETWCEAEVHRVAGEIALKSPERDAAKAEAYFERALVVAREQQAKSWELHAATSMARLCCDQGKRHEARALLAPPLDAERWSRSTSPRSASVQCCPGLGANAAIRR